MVITWGLCDKERKWKTIGERKHDDGDDNETETFSQQIIFFVWVYIKPLDAVVFYVRILNCVY